MSAKASRLLQAWYTGSPWLWLLSPLTLLFYAISRLRRLAYRLGLLSQRRCDAPVIVVGNISVGGTGKTPLVLSLVEALQARGFKPGIVSRGYGASPPELPWLVMPESSATHSGDEPLLLAQRSGVPVVIAPDRAAACRTLVAKQGCDVIISDDGLQHYAMQRDIEIVVLDAERGVGNGYLLPMGPLREPVSRLQEVDLLVSNGEPGTQLQRCLPADLPPLYNMQLKAAALQNLGAAASVDSEDWLASRRVHAIAGIGNPQRFFHTLQQLGFECITHAFDDHHAYKLSDIRFDDDLPVIMTEKDAVKCRALLGAQAKHADAYWYLPVNAALAPEFFDTITEKLTQSSSP